MLRIPTSHALTALPSSIAALRRSRSFAILASALLVVCGAILVTRELHRQAELADQAEGELMALRLDLVQMRDIPWGASPDEGADPDDVRAELQAMEDRIEATVAKLSAAPGLPERREILVPFRETSAALWEILEAVAQGKPENAGEASERAAVQMYAADEALQVAADRYEADSGRTLTHARTGSVAMIVVLFAAFGWFFTRAVRRRRTAEGLAAENRRLLAASRKEALTDALTELGNRRALIADLERATVSADEQLLLVLFDLDGFKGYNDSFGHAAGDALLARLGERLATTMAGIGSAYRMGGDEFCVLATVPAEGSEAISALAAAALSEAGEGFTIGCSYGAALLPADAARPDQALLLADQRMYEHKRTGRIPPSRQSADVLLQLLAERSRELGQHTSEVAVLSELTAERLGLPQHERARIRLAAELHDVGKAAIPDSILDKPGKLSADEWEFVRRHTVIGERIVRAAPSLAHAADLVRGHHERHDGTGYPDRLAGEDVPVGARIIAVSDAFDAMTSDRPYHRGISVADALAELQRCAGTQFDPNVVAAFVAVLSERGLAEAGFTAARTAA